MCSSDLVDAQCSGQHQLGGRVEPPDMDQFVGQYILQGRFVIPVRIFWHQDNRMKHPIGQRCGDAVRLPQGDAPPCAAHGEGRALHRQGSLELPAAPPIGQGEIQEARSGSRAPDHGLQGNIQRCLLRLRRGFRYKYFLQVYFMVSWITEK